MASLVNLPPRWCWPCRHKTTSGWAQRTNPVFSTSQPHGRTLGGGTPHMRLAGYATTDSEWSPLKRGHRQWGKRRWDDLAQRDMQETIERKEPWQQSTQTHQPKAHTLSRPRGERIATWKSNNIGGEWGRHFAAIKSSYDNAAGPSRAEASVRSSRGLQGTGLQPLVLAPAGVHL